MHLNNFVGEYNLKFCFVCLEINECTVNPDICGAGHCVNLPVGYTCICYEGYRLNDQQTKCSGMNGCFQESEITMLWNVWNVDSNQEGYATEQSGAASSTRCFQTTQKTGSCMSDEVCQLVSDTAFHHSELNVNLIEVEWKTFICEMREKVIRQTISSQFRNKYLKWSNC